MNCIYELLINLIKTIKTNTKNNKAKYCEIDEFKITDYQDVFNSMIRHIEIPEENYYVSKEAIKLWEKLSKDNIFNYHYTDSVKYDFTEPIRLPHYTGGAKKTNLYIDFPNKNNKFDFRSVFHEEHITDIKSICKKLISLPDEELTEENIHNILSNICIAIILKEEDHKLKKNDRGITFKEAIPYYDKEGIELLTKAQYIEYYNKRG